jgi:hypothetical protein
VTIITDDADFLEKLVGYVGDSISGYNPLAYMGTDDKE